MSKTPTRKITKHKPNAIDRFFFSRNTKKYFAAGMLALGLVMMVTEWSLGPQSTPLSMDTLYWTFSTTAQVMSMLLACAGLVTIFKLTHIKNSMRISRIRQSFKDLFMVIVCVLLVDIIFLSTVERLAKYFLGDLLLSIILVANMYAALLTIKNVFETIDE